MPDALKIEIKDIPDVGEILDRQRQPMLEAGRLALTDLLERNFDRKNQAGNARGWPSSKFWERVAASVTSAADGDGFSATIAEPGVRLRWKGGTVTMPTPNSKSRLFAIPARPEAAGMNPREAKGRGLDLVRIWPKHRNAGMLAVRENGRLRAYWWLVSKTTHKPDPSVIPPETEIRDKIVRAMRRAWRAEQ